MAAETDSYLFDHDTYQLNNHRIQPSWRRDRAKTWDGFEQTAL